MVTNCNSTAGIFGGRALAEGSVAVRAIKRSVKIFETLMFGFLLQRDVGWSSAACICKGRLSFKCRAFGEICKHYTYMLLGIIDGSGGGVSWLGYA
jgi:hypothetical protein